MPETKFRFLGSQIRAARKRNNLTQQKLADKTGLAIKTVQETEKGKKNATYDTLSKLIECLGISADTLFPTKTPIDNEKLQSIIRKIQLCNEKNQEVLLNTIGFLADQLLSEQEQDESN
nr:helix-turn-helix transcriptional regulator [uncultured Oscillibacter sp.]